MEATEYLVSKLASISPMDGVLIIQIDHISYPSVTLSVRVVDPETNEPLVDITQQIMQEGGTLTLSELRNAFSVTLRNWDTKLT